MKVHFSYSENNYQAEIPQILSELGHRVSEYKHSQFDLSQLLSSPDKDIASLFKEFGEYIKAADVFVIEMSNEDPVLFYEISRAISLKKYTLILSDKKLKSISKIRSKYITFKNYNLKNIRTILEEYLAIIEKQTKSRIIFNITPQQNRFLDWIAREENVSKAEVIRTAIGEHIKTDEQYSKG